MPLSIALLVISAACGGSGSETSSTSATREAQNTDAPILEAKDQPDEGALRDVALEGGHVLIDGDATKVYSLYHKSFQEKCPFNKFVGVIALLRGFYGESFQKSEPRVEDVRI